jgi:AcrR family transcriptional regulator
MTRPANPDLPRRVLEEAARVVAKDGHESLNMRALARTVGVTATAIYHYFENRSELLHQVRLQAVEQLNDRIRALPEDLDPHERLHKLGEEYVAFADAEPNLYRLVFEEPIDETLLADSDRDVLYFTYFTARECLEAMSGPTHPEGSAPYQAMIGWVMLHGFASLRMSGTLQLAEGMDRRKLTEMFLSAYSRGGISRA